MSTGDPGPSRTLSDHEQELWRGVTRSVVPLKPKRLRSRPSRAELSPVPEKKRPMPTKDHPEAARVARMPKGPPPLLPIDRRTRQRIARGAQAIEARIDLHGRTQGEAHEALLRFLHRAQRDGARIALVITGKGGRAGEGAIDRGILKRQVPLWLALPEFRIYVAGFDDARVEHGGEGALYVRLRRPR